MASTEATEREKRTVIENFEREKRCAEEAERERLMEIAEVQREKEEKRMEQERVERKLAIELATKERTRLAEQHEARIKEDRDKAEAEHQQRLQLSLELAEEKKKSAVLELEYKHKLQQLTEQLSQQQDIANTLGMQGTALPELSVADVDTLARDLVEPSSEAVADVVVVSTPVVSTPVAAYANTTHRPTTVAQTSVSMPHSASSQPTLATSTARSSESRLSPTVANPPAPVSEYSLFCPHPTNPFLTCEAFTTTSSVVQRPITFGDAVSTSQSTTRSVTTYHITPGSYTFTLVDRLSPSTTTYYTQSGCGVQHCAAIVTEDKPPRASMCHTTATYWPPIVTSVSSVAVSCSPSVVVTAAPTLSATPSLAPVVTSTVATPAQPVVIVRQFQTLKPYSGQTSHKSFKEHFERVAKANGWTTELEKMQNLALALEGPAVECLREVREDEVGAYERI